MNEMHTSERYERTARDLLEAIFRHKKKALLFFLTVVTATVVVLAVTPGTYTSTAKLMIRRGNADVVLDPSASAGEVLPLYKEWESEINTELEILGSRELVSEVIQSLGSEVFLKSPDSVRPGLLSPVRSLFMKCRNLAGRLSVDKTGPAGQLQIDRLIPVVEKNLKIEARKKSDVITVSYTTANPELAREVVKRLVAVYLDRRINMRRVPGAYQFFTQQADQLAKELGDAENCINTMKNTVGVSSLEDSRRALQTTIGTIQTQQIQNKSSLAAADARVATLRAMLSQQTPADSSVKTGTLLDRTELQALQTLLRHEEITQASLVAESAEIDKQLAQLYRKLDAMTALDTPMHRLQRDQGLLEEKYRKYSGDKEQARINEELEARKISNVSIVQHATLPAKTNPSGKLFQFLAALFMGIVGAVAVALGANGLDPTMHSASDVSERLHLPPLIELPLMSKAELYSLIGSSGSEESQKPRSLFFGKVSSKRVEECFQELLFKLLALRTSGESGPFVIGVTSSSGGEGASSVAVNLAAAFARDDRFTDTVLLNASMQELPEKVAEQMKEATFTYRQINGKQEALEGENKPSAVAVFADHLARIKKQGHEVIVVDLPSVNRGGSTLRVAAASDLVVLVVAAGRTPWRTALRTAGLLTDARAKLCGVVLNRRHLAIPAWFYRKL